MERPDRDDESTWWIIVRRGEVLVTEGPSGFRLPQGPRAPIEPSEPAHPLGRLEGGHMWGYAAAEDAGEPHGHYWINLRKLYGQVPDHHWVAAGRAEQIVSWDRTHRFCGRCGTPTLSQDTERARKCPDCGLLAYPRLSPATIMLVTRGEHDEEALLAHGRLFPGRFYSALAGFVEPGESLEDCVAREVKEETNIDVKDITYFASQPWPFPNSLMLGFTARYAGGELRIQEEEIVDAGWYTIDNLPPSPRGGMSIAGWLIEDWIKRQEARA